jgi:hypothetical protein
LHGSADADGIDFCVDGEPIAENLGYAGLQPAQVPPGSHTITIREHNGTACAGSLIHAEDTPDLAEGTQFLAIAMGEESPNSGDPDFGLTLYTEDFALGTAPAQGALKVIHAASASNVYVGTIPNTSATELNGSDIIIGPLSHAGNSNTDFVVDAGSLFIGLASAFKAGQASVDLGAFQLPISAGFRGWVVLLGDTNPALGEESLSMALVGTGPDNWTVTGPFDPV